MLPEVAPAAKLIAGSESSVSLATIEPTTWNLLVGFVVPTPTFPVTLSTNKVLPAEKFPVVVALVANKLVKVPKVAVRLVKKPLVADKIEVKDTVDYVKDVIIRKADTKPHKTLVLHMRGGDSLLTGPMMYMSFQVVDAVGKIRYSGDHFHLAVKAYNKLYNE